MVFFLPLDEYREKFVEANSSDVMVLIEKKHQTLERILS